MLNDLNLLVNLGILFTSFVACIYCYILSEKIKKLSKTENNTLKIIEQLRKSINDFDDSIARAHRSTDDITKKITLIMNEGNQISDELKELIEESKILNGIKNTKKNHFDNKNLTQNSVNNNHTSIAEKLEKRLKKETV